MRETKHGETQQEVSVTEPVGSGKSLDGGSMAEPDGDLDTMPHT